MRTPKPVRSVFFIAFQSGLLVKVVPTTFPLPPDYVSLGPTGCAQVSGGSGRTACSTGSSYHTDSHGKNCRGEGDGPTTSRSAPGAVLNPTWGTRPTCRHASGVPPILPGEAHIGQHPTVANGASSVRHQGHVAEVACLQAGSQTGSTRLVPSMEGLESL